MTSDGNGVKCYFSSDAKRKFLEFSPVIDSIEIVSNINHEVGCEVTVGYNTYTF